MKLFYSPASPYVAKIRLAAAFVNLPLDCVAVDAGAVQPELIVANPLGKIPTLIDGDEVYYDSRIIMAVLNEKSGGKLYPDFATQRCEAFWDGVADAGVSIIYEHRYRPENKWHQPWMDRQMDKINRALDLVQSDESWLSAPIQSDQPNAAKAAMLAVLSWFDLRLDGKWRETHLGLVAPYNNLKEATFSNRTPVKLADLLPHA